MPSIVIVSATLLMECRSDRDLTEVLKQPYSLGLELEAEHVFGLAFAS